MQIPFTKMHGLGNDFVLLDARHTPLSLSATSFARLADRRYGVGCDQVLVLEPPTLVGALACYRVINADGTVAGHCGNGVRCVAKYLHDAGEVRGTTLEIEIDGRAYTLTLAATGEVKVDMGIPSFVPAEIPLDVAKEAPDYALTFEGEELRFGAVSMGNPHAVFCVTDVALAPVVTLGTFLQTHPLFPARVNVGFMEQIETDRIRLRVFERGAGETPACGTGACAAVALGIRAGRLARCTEVLLPGGALKIEWSGESAPLFMTGPAATVFKGTIEL